MSASYDRTLRVWDVTTGEAQVFRGFEDGVFWTAFLRSLRQRGLAGVRLVISDAHEGLKGAIRRVMGATWQRCRVHWTRNALAYVPKAHQTMVAAGLRQAFQQPDQAAARASLSHFADQLHNRWPKLKVFVDDQSLPYVHGSQIDYIDQLTGAGFQVNNPNVVAACGCGSSFQVKEDAAASAAV